MAEQVTLAMDMPRESPAASPFAAARHEVWEHLPAWMYLVYGCMMLNALLTNLVPPRPDLAFTAAFPLLVFGLYYTARALRAPDVERRGAMLTTAWALAIIPALVVTRWHRPSPLSSAVLRDLYEGTNFAWVALLFFHSWRKRRSHVLLYFGAAFVYGAILENGGILLGYFSETHLRTMVHPFVAPVSTMIGWSMVIYLAFWIVRGFRAWIPSLQKSVIASAFLMALSATMLDMEIDPIASQIGCWVWDRSLPPALGEVPLVNFIAWMSALFPYGYMVFRYQEIAGLTDEAPWTRRHLAFATVASPAVLVVAAVMFCTLITLTEGGSGPSWSILFRFFASAVG